jgi:hypothetical protein
MSTSSIGRILTGTRVHHSSWSAIFRSFRNLLLNTPADKLQFAIYGVQPGIALSKVDDHLSDLMAFGIDYVHRGGAARAAWLVSP